MKATTDFQRLSARQVAPRNNEPHPNKVLPFGRYGAGHLTGHPIGLVIVLGVLLMGLVGLPVFSPFFAGSLVLGGLFGLFLWLRHR